MSVYFDVSVLIAQFAIDALNERTDRAIDAIQDTVVVSDFAVAEFSSVIATRVRTRALRPDEARNAFSDLDTWSVLHARRVEVVSTDIVDSIALVRRLDLSLRAPDALHLAIAQRLEARLMTFDKMMMKAARSMGIKVVNA